MKKFIVKYWSFVSNNFINKKCWFILKKFKNIANNNDIIEYLFKYRTWTKWTIVNAPIINFCHSNILVIIIKTNQLINII